MFTQRKCNAQTAKRDRPNWLTIGALAVVFMRERIDSEQHEKIIKETLWHGRKHTSDSVFVWFLTESENETQAHTESTKTITNKEDLRKQPDLRSYTHNIWSSHWLISCFLLRRCLQQQAHTHTHSHIRVHEVSTCVSVCVCVWRVLSSARIW